MYRKGTLGLIAVIMAVFTVIFAFTTCETETKPEPILEKGKAATPVAYPPAGTYSGTQLVMLTSETEEASIYYTTDGSTPTVSSNLYSGTIAISDTATPTTLRAIAVKSGMTNSDVLTAIYTITKSSMGPLTEVKWLEILQGIESNSSFNGALDLSDYDRSASATGGGLRSDGIFDPLSNISIGKRKITSIILPASTTGIFNGTSASPTFRHFNNLETFNGNLLSTIGDFSFAGCTKLNLTELPAWLTSIGNNAFQGCIGLTAITIPNSVVNIGSNAFADCTALTSVTFMGTLTASDFPSANSFPGDLRAKYLAPDGGTGTYTRPNGTSEYWTKTTHSPITTVLITDVIVPVNGEAPSTASSSTGNFTRGNVMWSPTHNTFTGGQTYTAGITLTANNEHTFTGLVSAAINESLAEISNNTGKTVTISLAFPETGYLIDFVYEGTGTASSDPVQPLAGTTAAISALPGYGYRFVRWETVSGGIPSFSPNAATNPASFTMPPNNVSIKAVFEYVTSAELTVSHTVFDHVNFGYTQPAAHNVTISNTGMTAAAVTNIALGGTDAASFTLGNTNITNIAPGSSADFTVRPNANLSVGTYNAAMTVTYDGGRTAFNNVQFVVNSAPITSADITVTAPVTGATPSTASSGSGNFTRGNVTWSPTHSPFQGGQVYTASITLTANNGYTFTGLTTANINGSTAAVSNNTGEAVTLTHAFQPTALAPITSTDITITAPVTGATPSTASSGTGNFTRGNVTWSPAHSPFQGGQVYTASITLTANSGYTFTGLTTANINGSAAVISNNTGTTVTLTHAFPETATSIISANITVTAPVTGATPSTESSGSGNFTRGNVTWSPAHSPFQGGQVYTASIMLTANNGYTFTGLTTANINGSAAIISNDTGETVTLTHSFPETALAPITSAAITLTAPVTGATPSTASSGTGNFTRGNVTWSPTHSPFQGGQVYTASITLTANSGYTFTGLTTANINGSAATVNNNIGTTVTLTHAFSETALTPITTPIGIEIVWINPGTFTMGSSDDSQDYGASPPHQVTISKGFWMGKYEVTQELYQAVTGVNPSYFHGGSGREPAVGEVQGRRPVERITWYDAVEFCNKLSAMEGLTSVYTITGRSPATGYPITSATVTVNWSASGYRLPTEAEWEYACRAGTTTAYNTGNTISDNTGWYLSNSNSRTHEVGKKPANAWGLYDMHGNVYEWCWDWYGTYASGAQTDPVGAASGSVRVIRGGSWGSNGQNLRSADRGSYYPSSGSYNVGFRLLRP